jgi:DNA mismatch endonuclease (patch repair protein)
VQPKGILGQPDFAFAEARIAIFVDSCFWHGCPKHLRRPKSNRSYWDAKIDGNKRRDKRLTARLQSDGWKVVRFWEHDICGAEKVIGTLRRFGIVAS